MKRTNLELEALEERSLLSASLSSTGVLKFTPDNHGLQAEAIVLRINSTNTNLYEVVVNGQTQYSGPVAAVKQIEVTGSSTNDVITVQDLAAKVEAIIKAGDGNDTINVGNDNLYRLDGLVIVDGQGDIDTINVTDHINDPLADHTYTMTSGTVRRDFFGGLNFGGVENVVLNAKSGRTNYINVDSTALGTTTTVNGGDGWDVIHLATGNLSDIKGPVIVNDQGNSGFVVLFDNGQTSGATYTVTSSTVARSNFGGLTYLNIDGVGIEGQKGNNTFNVLSTLAGTNVSLGGDVGNDTFNLGTGNLNSLQGEVEVNGWLGVDALNIIDNGTAANDTYTVDNPTNDILSIARANFGGVTFQYVDTTTLYGENGNNTFNIVGNDQSLFQNDIYLNGGRGNDTFKFHPGLSSTIAVNGGDGNDTLDYSALTTGVNVQFANFTATDTNLVINVENAIGSAGSDFLFGDAGNNILIGGPGSDLINGGDGFDILIGGTSGDTITGAGGDDIVIGGTTSFDANTAALQAILAEWTSGRDFNTRIANINGSGTGTRLNGNFFLKTLLSGQTVFEDGGGDQLSGGAGSDWFFTTLSEANDRNFFSEWLN